MDKISIVVPCFNEEQSLKAFYKETSKVLKTLPVTYELIFVNDGSRDNTLSIIKEIGYKTPTVNYISFSRNFGKEAAMYAGLKNASGDYVVIMDADLQHPPYLLKQMYNKISLKGYDCVGAKIISRDKKSGVRNFLSKGFYKVMHKLTSNNENDAGDYRMMNRQYVEAMLSMKEVNRYTKGIMNYVGFNCFTIEYENVERIAGKSKWSLISLMKYAIEGIVSFSTLPLVLPFFIGGLLLMASIIVLLQQFIMMLISSANTTLVIISTIFFGISLILISVGVVGEYLAKMYNEIKQRPVYIISESYFHKAVESQLLIQMSQERLNS